jgi:hypothetical protein
MATKRKRAPVRRRQPKILTIAETQRRPIVAPRSHPAVSRDEMIEEILRLEMAARSVVPAVWPFGLGTPRQTPRLSKRAPLVRGPQPKKITPEQYTAHLKAHPKLSDEGRARMMNGEYGRRDITRIDVLRARRRFERGGP